VVASHKLIVWNFVGDVPRVDGQLAVARAFGDKSLKRHLSSDPDVAIELIDNDVDLIILASDGLWKVSCSLKLELKYLEEDVVIALVKRLLHVFVGNVQPRGSGLH